MRSMLCLFESSGETAGRAIAPPARAASAHFPSLSMTAVARLAERVARGTLPVLILGETGVGKEILTEYIHSCSPRASRPLVRVNCAALSATLIQSELFGHERGAFTGAAVAKAGILQTAEGGTVLLDEIGDLALELQTVLLRVLERKEVLPVGGTRPRPIDVRFIAATHRDLSSEVIAGRFRQDLYFRLNGITIAIPPLRERKMEIDALADLFLARACTEAARSSLAIDTAARDLLRGYAWPGNIRELRNVLERAVLLATGDRVLPEHLPWLVPVPRDDEMSRQDVPRPLDPVAVREALARTGGNQTDAARVLGVSRRTLIKRMEKYGLPRPRKR